MTKAFLESRLGRIFVSRQAIEDGLPLLLFLTFLPISAHYDEETDCYEYVGYSEKFTALTIKNPIPIYKPIFQSEQDVLSSERIVSLLEFRRC